MPSKRTPTEETYTAAELPEFLRSPLVAGIVLAALESSSQDSDAAAGEYAAPTRAVIQAAATEIREWHLPRPRPADFNGGQ